MDKNYFSKWTLNILGLVALAALFVFAHETLKPGQSPQVLGTETFGEIEALEYSAEIIIPKIKTYAPIIETSNISGDWSEDLKSGVVHYPGTAMFGEVGNAYLFGHSSDLPSSHGLYKEIFKDLPLLERGDLIIVITSKDMFSYEVIETKVVESDDFAVLDQQTSGRKILTLQTSYPVGTAKQRYIVVSELK